MVLQLIFIPFVVCSAEISEFHAFFLCFFAHFGNFLLVSFGACDRISLPSVVVSLSMSQTRGSCGHFKGATTTTVLVLTARVVSDPAVAQCVNFGPTPLGLWCLSVGVSLTDRRWARRRRERRKQRKGRIPPLGRLPVQDPVLNRLLRGRTHPGLPLTVMMMTTPQFCLCHHRGVSGYAGTLG